jgi:aminopeptidase N
MSRFTRACASLLLTAAFSVTALAAPAPKVHPRPYGRDQARYQKTEIAPYTFENTILKVRFDFDKGIVYGQATNVVHPKADGLATVAFDSVGLNYSAVTVNGAPAKYRVADDHLYVDLAAPAKAGDRLEVVSTYTATPSRGIYFIRPDKYYPKMQPEIWSQGEMIDNRRWFPTWDEPNEKTPIEQIVTVPKGWTVIANGEQKAQTDGGDGTTTFDWVMPGPISTYLIAFSAGPYATFHTSATQPDGTGQIPVDFFTSQDDAKWASMCFGNTKDIVEYFQKIIGVAYPWSKYDQTTVERFTAGGMENASATTQTELAIHAPWANTVRPCDSLVSHELSHQWWGDDVTATDWANIWINEGYATYFEELWMGHQFGEGQFQYERYEAQQSYFGETKRYWRPIVDYVYGSPGDSFDSSGYPRPGQVLHMLRYMYGDQRFFGALRDYLNEYQHKNADTHQFFAAISKSLGENLNWFEQEWFYRAAYPHFFVKQSYDAKSQTLTLDVTQKSHDGQPFRMPVQVAVYVNGKGKMYRFTADRAHQIERIAGVTAMPQMVLFDPNNNIIRELDYVKSVQELGYQAIRAPYVSDRLWAIDQLGNAKKPDRALAASFVRDAVINDPFYGVRSNALDAAASLGDAATIRSALHDGDIRVQIAAANAVGELDHPDDPGLVADLKALTNSPNPLVAGAACTGLGATKNKGVYAILKAGLQRHAFREPIIGGAIAGLAAYGDPKAIALIEPFAAYGADESLRSGAIGALAMLGKKDPTVRAYIVSIAVHDPYYRARGAAIRALGKIGDASTIPILASIRKNDSEESAQNGAWDAMQDIKDRLAIKKGTKH